jgi:putative acyl-CoA dehydrogenase
MAQSPFDTHDVYNQPPPIPARNLFETDPILYGAMEPMLDAAIETSLGAHGAFWGSPEARELARLAHAHPPLLRTHDAHGRRIDTIEYHPAYHAMMRRSAEAGLGSSLRETDRPEEDGRRAVLRAARLYLTATVDTAHLTAWCHTSAGAGVLAGEPDLAAQWLPGLLGRRYDHRSVPIGAKSGLSLAIALTEKQGGPAVTDTTTAARQMPDGHYRVVGHKWFVSAPTADALVTLAETRGGPTAFLVPRFRPDDTQNRVRFQRLKDKAGHRAAAAVELELADAEAIRIGAEGGGAALLAAAQQELAMDAATLAAGLARGAMAHAVHHVRHRAVGGARLADQPLMARVLADATLDVAAATALVIRLAEARDRAAEDPAEDAYARLIAPAAKYWIAKLAPALVAECLECLGGNGYVEDLELARFYRDAPALSLWGAPGNVLALDLLAILDAAPEALDGALAEITGDLGKEAGLTVELIRNASLACQDDPGSGRILIEQLALASAAAALHRFAPRAITDAFLDTRLTGGWRTSYGMLDSRFDAKGIVDYAFPPG